MQINKTNFNLYFQMTKPRIVFFCVLMAVCGYLFLKIHFQIFLFVSLILGCSFTVASANILNMVLEKESDGLMARTCKRPLVRNLVSPRSATLLAVFLGLLGCLFLIFFVNPLTAGLAMFSLFSYVFIYTPLKKRHPIALFVGAIPGAVPVLLGTTAATGRLDRVGVVLFLVLFSWQMPHFIAISIRYKEDYGRAGLRVVPIVRGDEVAKIQSLFWTFFLLSSSLAIYFIGVASLFYFFAILILGLWFTYLASMGVFVKTFANWPRRFFWATLIYLPAFCLILLTDRLFFHR